MVTAMATVEQDISGSPLKLWSETPKFGMTTTFSMMQLRPISFSFYKLKWWWPMHVLNATKAIRFYAWGEENI